MKSKYLIICFLFSFICMLSCLGIKAQTNKIGIVFDADTTLICQHVGLTIFSNSTNKLPLNVNMQEALVQNLKAYLDTKYVVDIIELPDSLKNKDLGLFDSGIGKKLSKWAKTKDKNFDIIVFIRNQDIPREWNVIVPQNTNGVYSRQRNTYLYTTITFYAYRTSNAKLLEYYNQGGESLHKLKNFKLPKDKKTFNPEDLSFLEEEYKRYLDQRIKYFLTKTYLIPNIDQSAN